MVDYYARGAAKDTDPKRVEAAAEEAKRFAAQGAENPFLDVWFEDDKSGFVVGAFGLILRTADGGSTWEPWLHAIDNPKAQHLYAVRGVGADVYITGEQGLVLKLDRAAGRFLAVEVPYKGTLFGVTGNSRAVVVHGLRGTVLRSSDGGRSWQAVPTEPAGRPHCQHRRCGQPHPDRQPVRPRADQRRRRREFQGRAHRATRFLPRRCSRSDRDAVVVAGPRGVQSQSLQ